MWGFFYVARMDEVLTGRGWAAAIYPASGDPSPQHARADCGAQATGQAVPEPGQTTQSTTHTPKRWTRCTGLHPIPDRPRRVDRDGGGGWTACNVFGKVYNFGRLFLSIFIWIYFAESIDNPYIYGYNIISPDKYGLQPH